MLVHHALGISLWNTKRRFLAKGLPDKTCSQPASPHRFLLPSAILAQIADESSAARKHQSGLPHTGQGRDLLTRSIFSA
jgi:hypothetical protein